jgi:hypothetical protein
VTGQRDRVRASLLVQAQRETHHDVYGRRRARLASDPVTVRAVSRSIRDLGELLDAAESDEARGWLVLRLQNRLDVLDVLMARGGSLRGVTG